MPIKRLIFFKIKFPILAIITIALLICSDIVPFVKPLRPGVTIAHAAENKDTISVWPHQHSDLKPDPAVHFYTLPNNFRYVLMNNFRPKDRVSIHLNVQAGSLHESEDQQGLAHFLEHMLFNGSTHFEPGELVKYFQKIGMQFGPDANARTGFNSTVYDILLSDNSPNSLKDGLIVMKDFAEGALLLQSEVDRERKVILAEKRTRDSASYRTFVSTLGFEFPEALISQRLPIGKESVIQKVGRKHLKHIYDTWYRPETMILIMVGDFDISQASSLIEEMFSKLTPRAPPTAQPDIGKIDHHGIKTFHHYEEEVGDTTIAIEVVNRVEPTNDSSNYQKQMLTRNVANRIVQNRLNAMIGKPDIPFTSASIGSGRFLEQIDFAEISAKSNPEDWEKALSLIEQTLRKALKFGFMTSEIERVKKDMLSDLDKAIKQSPTRESGRLARQIIRSLNSNRVFLSPEHEKELFAPMIKQLTQKSLEKAFNDIWASDHRLILLTGNADLTKTSSNPEDYIRLAYNTSSKKTIEEPTDITSVTFPYLPTPKNKGKITLKNNISDIGILQVDFDNNFRLNLKKTDFKADEILIKLSFGFGKSTEPDDKPGLATLSEDVINESGLGSLDKDQIERALAGKNANVTFGIAEDHFYFVGNTTSEDLELMFQILYAHLKDPGYREDAYTLSMNRFKQQYQSLTRSIEGNMKMSGRRFLAGGDNRFGLPSFAEFSKLTLGHIRSWINASLVEDEFEVSVVGDFDVDSILNLASVYFGSLPTRHHTPDLTLSRLPVFPDGKSHAIKVETEIPKGLVVLAYPSEDIWNISRTRRLSVLSSVFSERLRVDIREKLGAAYSPYAYNRSSRAYPGFGIFQTYVYVDPKQVDLVINEVKSISSDLVKTGVSDEEMQRALDPILTSIKDMMRKNNYWLNTVLAGSKRHPEQIEWSKTIQKDYASIKIKELTVLAKTYLDNSKVATIVITPE